MSKVISSGVRYHSPSQPQFQIVVVKYNLSESFYPNRLDQRKAYVESHQNQPKSWGVQVVVHPQRSQMKYILMSVADLIAQHDNEGRRAYVADTIIAVDSECATN